MLEMLTGLTMLEMDIVIVLVIATVVVPVCHKIFAKIHPVKI